ncbi:MAG: F0F1 ATP synthase subunit alpha, partial [Dehalococcoidales bacterium]|nr:F0F1 ATP synthase subunit alpha [Dehalococcoidales bacterium]
MTSSNSDIIAALKAQVSAFDAAPKAVDVGTIISVGDGIARISGLSGASYSELLQFPGDVMGMAL